MANESPVTFLEILSQRTGDAHLPNHVYKLPPRIPPLETSHHKPYIDLYLATARTAYHPTKIPLLTPALHTSQKGNNKCEGKNLM